jgi:O-antigen ligase
MRSGLPTVSEIEHRDSAAPFWALMAFTFILFISPQSFLTALAPLRLALVAAVLAVLTYLFDRLVHHRPVLEFTREIVIAACLLGWAILTLPLSYWPGGSLGVLLDIYFKTLIVFWLLGHVVNTVPRLRLIAWGLSLMAVPLALTALANLASGNYLQQGFAPEASRILGYNAPLTGNPNDLALTLNLILPLSVALFLCVRKPAARAALLACICLDAIAIIATFSRAGFLTLGVTFVAYLWALFKRGQRHWAFLALFLVLASVPLLPSGYMDRLSTITDIEADPTGSAQARWGDTLAAVKYVAYHPIVGVGLGMDTLALNEVRGPVWKEIHNVYLQYAVDLGIPGLILFLMLLTGCLKSARDAQRRSVQESVLGELFYLAEGIRISLIAFAVAAFFHPVAYHFYFYYIAGLALAAGTINVSSERKYDRRLLSRHETT